MDKERIHEVPVTARSGHVVGIVTALDVARWLNTPFAGGGSGRVAGL